MKKSTARIIAFISIFVLAVVGTYMIVRWGDASNARLAAERGQRYVPMLLESGKYLRGAWCFVVLIFTIIALLGVGALTLLEHWFVCPHCERWGWNVDSVDDVVVTYAPDLYTQEETNVRQSVTNYRCKYCNFTQSKRSGKYY